MKICYIANYKDNTGYGNSAIEFIKALDAAGVDVVARCIRFNDNNVDPGEIVKKCEAKDLNNVTHCIQHTLPHNFCFKKDVKNLGLFFWETSNIDYSGWPEFISLMDGVICPNDLTYEAARKYNQNCKLVIHPIDTEKFLNIKPLNIPQLKNHFNFYFIGENVRRKNLHGLLKAFHSEFGPDEPVNLVIKTSVSGATPQQALEYTKQMCIETQENLKIYKSALDYKKEIIITDNLTEQQLLGLHLACDCFVMPSYGEGCCLPLYDAILAGKPFLCTQKAGMIDYQKQSVNSQPETVFGNTQTFFDLYSGLEKWSSPSSVMFAKKMREVYEKPFTYDSGNFQAALVKNYGYARAGQELKRTIENM